MSKLFQEIAVVAGAIAVAVFAPEIVLAGLGGAFTAGAITTGATAVALTFGSAILGTALQKHELRNQRDAFNAGLQSRTVTRIATDAPLRYIYGRARVGSDIVAMFTSGANDEFRHLVCVHAAHECDAIEEIYINGEALGTLDGSGNVTTGIYASGSATNVVTESHSSGSSFTLAQTPIWTSGNHSVVVTTGTGSSMVNVPVLSVVGSVVTTGLGTGTACVVTYQVNAGGTPRVRVQKHLGTATDTADATLMSDLTSGTWPSTSVLRGFCYTVIRLDLNQPTFQNGMPSIEARIRGKKLYDPRTSTTAWSSNPALAVWDYLVSPLCGVNASDLPTAAFITAANVCDDTSVVAAGRYTFNGTITSDQDQAKTLDAMAHSMAGTIVATTWAIQAGTYVAPIMALVQADIVGELSITPGISGASIYNGVKGQFIDVNNNYAVTDFIPFQNSAYRTADGIDYFANVDYPFTNTIQAVNNLASIYLADQRNSFTIVADFSLKAWPLQIGDRVTLTSAFIGQTTAIYRVTDKKYSPTSAITLTLKQDDPSIWAYSSTTVQPLAPASNLANPWTILPLASITCTSGESALLRQPDGTTVPRILVSWPLAPTQAVKTNGQIEIQWQAVGSTAWESMQVNGGDTQAYISGVTGGAIYIVRGRGINPYMATKSDWIVTTYQVVIHSGVATVYQWASSMPAAPTGTASYAWSTSTFGTAPSGWSLTIPASPTAGGVTLWSASVSVIDITATGTTAFDWSKASVSSTGYAPSTIGGSVTVFAYQRSASAPSGTPGAATYTFSTTSTPGAITTPSSGVLANGWTTYFPSGVNPLWVTQVLASAQTATFAIGSTAWSTAAILAQNGTSANIFATAVLYQWGPTSPTGPTGTSTYTWATGATTAAGSWSSTVPANPGTPGVSLWTVITQVTDVATATSSLITWASGYTVSAWSQNGATGPTGSAGVQSGAAIVYQWAATIPGGPAGAATYTWSTGAFGAAPSGWALNPGTSPSPGYTLWQARVGVTDSAVNTTTAFNWTSAAVTAAGYAGQAGSSYVTAYCASATGSTTTAPAATTGATSLPATNSGGLTGTYSATVPTLTSGQFMYQTDGIYNPATNQVTWSIPYWSSLKVGSISAISANLGAMTAGSIDIGTGTTSWHVDTSGNTWAGNASYASAPYRVSNAGAAVFTNVTIMTGASTIIDATGLKTGYEAPGTKNSDIVVGGRNLYPDSGLEQGSHPCTVRNNATTVAYISSIGGTDTPVAGSKMLYFAATGAGDTYVQLGAAFAPVQAGKTYSLSFYYKSSGLITNSSTNWRASDNSYILFTLTALGNQTTWTRHVQQWTCPSGVTYLDPSFGFGCSGAAWMAVDCIQVEEGNAATQWSPALEDTDATLTDKLSKSAASILAAPITLSTGGAIQLGTAAWTGTSPTGSGMVLSPKGIAGVNAGAATFTIDATTGAATFGGTISGASGTFAGTLTASNIVTTDNMVTNGVSSTDIFSSGLPAPGNPGPSFVVTRASKVLILVSFGTSPSSMYLQNASSTNLQTVSGNAGENGMVALSLATGTYYLVPISGTVTFAYVLKVMV